MISERNAWFLILIIKCIWFYKKQIFTKTIDN
jgi:hypothetical protein